MHDIEEGLEGSTTKGGKKHNSLKSRKPSSKVSLETLDFMKHLSAKISSITLLSPENLETNNIFLLIQGTSMEEGH